MKQEYYKNQIRPLDEGAMKKAKERWMSVAKPLFSLGKLEDAVVKIAGIKETPVYELQKKGLLIFCADNGIVEEGVTQTGQEVTAIVADNFTKKATSVCMMADVAGVDLFPVDIGMVTDVPSVTKKKDKVAYGTRNFAKEPAMTKEEVERAIQIGIEKVKELKEAGYDLIATGEMGIGNTTTSSALASILLEEEVENVTGTGAGLDSKGLKKKKQVIMDAIRKYQLTKEDPIRALQTVGGFDIAGMAGVCLGGAIYRVPIVLDGIISTVAALCMVKWIPEVADFLLPSHVSKEPAGQMVLRELGLSPFLTCDMCLGEGSGAVAVVPILEMGLEVYKKMGTFEEIEVEPYQILK